MTELEDLRVEGNFDIQAVINYFSRSICGEDDIQLYEYILAYDELRRLVDLKSKLISTCSCVIFRVLGCSRNSASCSHLWIRMWTTSVEFYADWIAKMPRRTRPSKTWFYTKPVKQKRLVVRELCSDCIEHWHSLFYLWNRCARVTRTHRWPRFCATATPKRWQNTIVGWFARQLDWRQIPSLQNPNSFKSFSTMPTTTLNRRRQNFWPWSTTYLIELKLFMKLTISWTCLKLYGYFFNVYGLEDFYCFI